MKTNVRHRFNSIDFLVLVLLIAAAATLVLRGDLARSIGLVDAGESAECVLCLSSTDPETAVLFRAGEKLIHPETGEVLGTIRAAVRENARVYSLTGDGSAESGFDPTKFDLTITLDTTARQTERGFLIGGTRYATPGDTLDFVLGDSRPFSALVLSSRIKG